MSAHVFLGASGVGDWIGPAIVAIVFFILPIVRSIREARVKQEQAERRARDGAPAPTPIARAPVETDMDEARRKWEALLRGEEVDARPKPAPAPAPAPRASEGEARRYPPAGSATGEMQAPFDDARNPETLTSLEPVLSESGPDTSFDEARLAEVEDEARARDDKQRRDDLFFAERESEAVRADVAQWIGTPASKPPVPVPADTTRRRNVFGPGRGLSTRSDLRRAILASEVLGRPVGLRDGSDEPGPVGLRR